MRARALRAPWCRASRPTRRPGCSSRPRAGSNRDGPGESPAGPAVRVPAEDQLGYRPPCHRLRILLGALNARRKLLAASLELRLGEDRLQQDLAEEIEAQREILLEHGESDRRAVLSGVALEA